MKKNELKEINVKESEVTKRNNNKKIETTFHSCPDHKTTDAEFILK